MSAAHRQGWCPGALRPMESGDGLIVRLRIIGGAMASDLARALAQCAEDFGNRQIDLSSRGNLQLRGVTQERLPELHARLDALGLLDEDPDVEAIRNILVSPLSGVDPSALCDVRPIARALDEKLRADARLRSLPGKSLFLIGDGGSLPLSPETADVGFVATATAQGPCFIAYLGGTPAGQCEIGDASDITIRASHAFLDLRQGDERRMRDLVGRLGTETLAKHAGLSPLVMNSERVTASHILGLHQIGDRQALGIGIAFGRLDAQKLRLLADMAEAVRGELRLSPWRAIFLLAETIDATLQDSLCHGGFILDDEAPARAVAACSGKPACLHGAVDAQQDALRLAPLAHGLTDYGVGLHISGCAKGCAHAAQAPVTLVGHDDGYTIILDGRAGDTPQLGNLSISMIESLLPRLAALSPAERPAFLQTLLCEASQ
jgi:precorrin-3B synthase